MYNSFLLFMAINHLADNKTDYTSYAAMKARDWEEGQAEDLAWQALHLVFLLSFSGTLVWSLKLITAAILKNKLYILGGGDISPPLVRTWRKLMTKSEVVYMLTPSLMYHHMFLL
jgi:hypothetical protein